MTFLNLGISFSWKDVRDQLHPASEGVYRCYLHTLLHTVPIDHACFLNNFTHVPACLLNKLSTVEQSVIKPTALTTLLRFHLFNTLFSHSSSSLQTTFWDLPLQYFLQLRTSSVWSLPPATTKASVARQAAGEVTKWRNYPVMLRALVTSWPT